MAEITVVNPPSMGKALGQYSQIMRVKTSELVYIAGQIANDEHGNVVGAGDFEAQCRQVYANIGKALTAVGIDWTHIIQFTNYVVHSQDIPKLFAFRKREFPRMFTNGLYPPATLLVVDRLAWEPYLLEVTAVAAI